MEVQVFNRDEKLVNLLNQADNKNLELIEEIESLNRIIDELKELVIALWHNDKVRFLNKEQIDLLNNTVFGNDEDLGSDKE